MALYREALGEKVDDRVDRKDEEKQDWQRVEKQQFTKYRAVTAGLVFNVAIYGVIFLVEYLLALKSGAEVLKADAFNNLTGTFSTVLLLTGVHIATDNDDDDDNDLLGAPLDRQDTFYNRKRAQLLRFGIETVFTLITGILMIMIALKVIGDGLHGLVGFRTQQIPQPIGMVGAAISTGLILIIYLVNSLIGKKTGSAALRASAKDSLGDALTSLGTLVAIWLMTTFRLRWGDALASVIVGAFVLIAGIQVFAESSLNLVGYFNPHEERKYRRVIAAQPAVQRVLGVAAHYNGGVIIVDCTVAVAGKLTVLETARIAATIKRQLSSQFNVADTRVVFVPAEDE